MNNPHITANPATVVASQGPIEATAANVTTCACVGCFNTSDDPDFASLDCGDGYSFCSEACETVAYAYGSWNNYHATYT